MAIYRWLQNTPLAEDQPPLGGLRMTLRAFNLVDRDDPLTTVIADKIIEIGATGLKDPVEISERTVKFLSFN